MYIFTLSIWVPTIARLWIQCTSCMHRGQVLLAEVNWEIIKVLLENVQWELTVKMLRAVTPGTVVELLMSAQAQMATNILKSTLRASTSL